MAARLLLPGMGGAYLSEQFADASGDGVDTIDASRCAQIAIQMHKVSGNPAGTVQIAQSFGAGFADLGNGIDVGTDGAVVLFPFSDGPFGQLKILNSVSAGVVQVRIVGFPMQVSN